MKKIILALAMSIVLVCLFAVGISAAAVTTETEVTLNDGTKIPLYDENGEGLIWFILSTDENGVNTYGSVAANDNTADNATNYVTYQINSTYGTNQMHDIYIKVWNAETSAYDSIAETQIVAANFRTFTQEYWSFGSIFNNNIEYIYHSSTARDSGDYTGFTKLQIVDLSLTTNFETFGEQAFKGCTALREVRIGNSETGYGLTCQNGNLFNGATSLTTVWFADISDVTSIVGNAFYDCHSLTGTYTFSKVTVIEDQAFRYAAKNEGTNLILNFPSVEKIGTGYSNTFVFANSGITELTFGDDVSYMSYNTFMSATRLWRIEFDGAAEGFNFPTYTFEDCSALKAFSIPEGMTKLPSRMFKSCSSLTAVYLPSTLTTIESGSQDHATFANCTNLYFVSSPFKYDSLDDIPSKPDVYYFPSGITSIAGGEVFKKCESLNKTLVFPAGVTSLSNGWALCAGINNPTLENIVFLGDMDNINTSAWNFTGKIYFANANDKSSSDITTYSNSKSTVFCNAVGNADTNHLYLIEKNEAPTCTKDGVKGTVCFCGKINPVSDTIKAQHDYNKTPVVVGWYYENNNYFNSASYQHECTICQELYLGETVENSKLFEAGGYSIPEVGTTDCISHTMKVIKANIDRYEQECDVEFRYGTVAAAGASIETPITFVDGAMTVGAQALVSEMTNTDYVKLVIKITGLKSGDQVSCNAYAIVNNTVTYLCDDKSYSKAQVKTF